MTHYRNAAHGQYAASQLSASLFVWPLALNKDWKNIRIFILIDEKATDIDMTPATSACKIIDPVPGSR